MNAAVRYQRMQGLSLVEVMVSLVIGLVVVGAVLVSYITVGTTGRQQAAYAEMNENAQLALTLIARDLLLAGFSAPLGVAADGLSFTRTYASRPVFGCSTGFAAPATTGAVACALSGSDVPHPEFYGVCADTDVIVDPLIVEDSGDLPMWGLGQELLTLIVSHWQSIPFILGTEQTPPTPQPPRAVRRAKARQNS